MKYVGQTSEMTVAMPQSAFSPETLEEIGQSYGIEHEKTYGYQADEPFQLVNIRVVARGISDDSRVPDRMAPVNEAAEPTFSERNVYFNEAGGWTRTPVVSRSSLADGAAGPLVVEEYDSTTVVPPGWEAALDELGNIVLERVQQ